MRSLHSMLRTGAAIARLGGSIVLLGGSVALLGAAAALAQDADAKRLALTEQSLGHKVYMAYCAPCHGRDGDGRGPDADGFAQPPTDFTQGIYKFRTTLSSIPADGDLARSIRVGMPGTEMVPFRAVLSERSINAVADYLRVFNEDLADPEAKPDPDDTVELPAERPFPRTAETTAEGKEIWENLDCADCHLEDGRGTKEETDDWDRPVFMVPFQWGYYKSGPDDADLYRSIATGMQGTTMPAFIEDVAEPEDIWKLVDYIRSLDSSENQGLIGTLFDFFLLTNPAGFDYSNY